MRPGEIVDPYAKARFGSLWRVVVHATEEGTDRAKVYAEATKTMIATGAWGAYRMVYHETKSGHRLHVGYRYARPTDWFLSDNGRTPEGPFRSKRIILRKIRVKSGTKTNRPGVYTARPNWLLFTRANAECLGFNPEKLP